MSDEALRALERRCRESGAPEDELAWLRALAREGRRAEIVAHLAALLADTDLQVVLGDLAPDDAALLGRAGRADAPRVADAAVSGAAERGAPGLGRGRWSAWSDGRASEAVGELLFAPLRRPTPDVRERVTRALLAVLDISGGSDGGDVVAWEARETTERLMWDEYGKTPHTSNPDVIARWTDTLHAGCVLLVRGPAFAALAVDEESGWSAAVPERRRLRGFVR